MEKSQIRKKIRHDFLMTPRSQREAWSCRIARTIASSAWFTSAQCVLLYASLQDEVDTEALMTACRAHGKVLVLPRIGQGAPEIELVEAGPAHALRAGYRGIPEPTGTEVVGPDEIDVAMIPGRAFDENCCRLGRGGGYYDRLLSRHDFRALTVGMAYELQILDDLPLEAHDVPVHLVVTEARTIGPARSR